MLVSAFAAAAIAAAPAPAVDLTMTGWARRGVDAAVRHWRDWPTACPSILVTTARFPAGTVAQTPRVGAITPADCRITWSTSWLPEPHQGPAADAFDCTINVHEYGHLIGRTHADPDPVMSADLEKLGDYIAPECKPPPPRARARKTTRRTPRA